MSTMVVNDVTTKLVDMASAVSSRKPGALITPFQTILSEEEKKLPKSSAAASAAKTNKASKELYAVETKNTSKSSSSTTTLKDIFKRASDKYGVSYNFLTAVAKAESDFNPKCVSSAGAMGIMQLMPENCKELGVKDPYDAEQNIMAAARLLKAHLKKYNGNYTLAAAAYNAGSGAVSKYGGVPPYKETQNYVKKIKKFMQEGVTVPDRKIKTDDSTGSGGSTGVEKSKKSEKKELDTGFDKGVMAGDEDFEKVKVMVGSGEHAVTMTYDAYLRYLELGTTGAG